MTRGGLFRGSPRTAGPQPRDALRLARQRGFTLVEMTIALAIVGALLVVAFGGLRVAVGAWQRGGERAEAQQHIRSLTLVLAHAVGAAYAYHGTRVQGETPTVLFKGEETRVEFVTQSSPLPSGIPVAFTAVVIELRADGERPGLVVRQRVLPNYDPFTEAKPVLEDESIKTLTLSYLGEGGWQSGWEPQTDGALPRAVRIALGTTAALGGRELPALTVAVGAPKR